MTLFSTSIWTGVSTLLKTIATYVMWKFFAIYTGPAGVALYEQFQNFLQMARSSVFCGINQGVVKYVAEYKDNNQRKSNILSSALALNLVMCAIISTILVVFSLPISVYILQTNEYQVVIKLVAVSTLLFALNTFCLSILNGELEIRQYVICTIANTILNFIVTIYLVIQYGFIGGLIGFILNQVLSVIFTVYFVAKSHWFKINSYFSGINRNDVVVMIKYSLMIFTTTLIVPFSLIIIRNYIAHTIMWKDAGYWQAIMRLSTGYLIVMNMMLSVYCLPKLSSIHNKNELKTEIIKTHKFIFPFIILGVITVYLFRKQVIIIMYSSEFLPVADMFKYQLIGDVARMGTWILTNILIAKALVRIFIFSEIFFSITYVLFTILFVHLYGLNGAAIGFSVNYTLYWIYMIIYSLWYLNRETMNV